MASQNGSYGEKDDGCDADIRFKVIEMLARYLGEEVDDMYNFDLIYRVNSSYAEKKNLPKDVIVQLLAKKIYCESNLKNHKKLMGK